MYTYVSYIISARVSTKPSYMATACKFNNPYFQYVAVTYYFNKQLLIMTLISCHIA